MKLGEFLNSLPAYKRIRIGCRAKGMPLLKNSALGGGFVFCGQKCDFNPKELENRYINELINKIAVIMMKPTLYKDAAKQQLDNLINQYCSIVPWYDREVIETYKGQYDPDSTVIIVKGAESFFEYSPDVPPLTPDTMDDSAARNLVDAIYKSAAEEYIYEPDHGRASALGRWIKSDPYGILDEPEAVLDACRKMRRKRHGK